MLFPLQLPGRLFDDCGFFSELGVDFDFLLVDFGLFFRDLELRLFDFFRVLVFLEVLEVSFLFVERLLQVVNLALFALDQDILGCRVQLAFDIEFLELLEIDFRVLDAVFGVRDLLKLGVKFQNGFLLLSLVFLLRHLQFCFELTDSPWRGRFRRTDVRLPLFLTRARH